MEEESLLFMMSSYVMSNIVYLILNLLVTNKKKKKKDTIWRSVRLDGFWIKHTIEVNTPIYIFYFYGKTIPAEASNFSI